MFLQNSKHTTKFAILSIQKASKSLKIKLKITLTVNLYNLLKLAESEMQRHHTDVKYTHLVITKLLGLSYRLYTTNTRSRQQRLVHSSSPHSAVFTGSAIHIVILDDEPPLTTRSAKRVRESIELLFIFRGDFSHF